MRDFIKLSSLCGLLTALLLSLSPAAHAQDARELFMRGQAAYSTGDYDGAVTAWTQAYGQDPRPLLQYNLAQAYERLGQLDLAITAYETYVNSGPADGERMESARAHIASLQQRVSQTGVLLTGGVDGAMILVDGEDRGRLPRPDLLGVTPGTHRIVVRADGYEDFVSTVAVSAGQSAPITVELRPGVAGQAATTGSSGGISTIGLIVAGSGAAIMAGGAVTGVLALTGAGDAPDSTGTAAEDARTMALVTDILIPVGLATAAAGVVLMFVLDDGSSDQARLVPVVTPEYAGLALDARF